MKSLFRSVSHPHPITAALSFHSIRNRIFICGSAQWLHIHQSVVDGGGSSAGSVIVNSALLTLTVIRLTLILSLCSINTSHELLAVQTNDLVPGASLRLSVESPWTETQLHYNFSFASQLITFPTTDPKQWATQRAWN